MAAARRLDMTRHLRVTEADVGRITAKLFLTEGDRSRNLSAYWVLLGLAATIAAAGVVVDSTATVIGAMIVAPLMTPIIGMAVALVLADRRQLTVSAGLVLSGALLVVIIGYAMGLLVPYDVVASTNTQVSGRVQPRLIDLVAALATGLVGAFALLRDDVSDTLPGVAIAISLVPPLAVVGLTAESRAWDESAGALLLFATNVAAILATATALLLPSTLRDAAGRAGRTVGTVRGRTLAVLVIAVLLIAVPLAYSSQQVVRDQSVLVSARPVVQSWAGGQDQVESMTMDQGWLHVVVLGPSPRPEAPALRDALDRAGLDAVPLLVEWVNGSSERVQEAG
jgi:uncharacterized hydrophobic protein (TIGR00271 family)